MPSSACSRSTKARCRSSCVACGRARSASATSSATSSTATASSSSSPSAGGSAIDGAAGGGRSLVFDADDPQLAASQRGIRGSVAFGLDDPRVARPALQHAADSKYCVRCGTPYVYAAAYVGHLGDYRCPNAATTRPPLELAGRDVALRRPRQRLFSPRHASKDPGRSSSALPGLYNVYNALAAAALARALGAALDEIAAGLERFSAAFGRFERIAVGDKRLLRS